MKRQKGYTIGEVLGTALVLGLMVGWVINIIDIVHAIAGPITGMFLLRLIGVFVAPLGGVLGWL